MLALAGGLSTITFTAPDGCTTHKDVYSEMPIFIGGSGGVCIGLGTLLTGSPGGTWVSSNPSVATINVSTGWVSGVSVGTTNITFTSYNGCESYKLMTSAEQPVIAGSVSVICIGGTIPLSATPSGGVWSSSNAVSQLSAPPSWLPVHRPAR